jgi:hypothetical protein
MGKKRTWLLLGGAVALVCALGVALALCARQGPDERPARSLAVVLVPELAGSTLVSVDADTGRVVGRLRLRSLATDIEADARAGTVVGAQTGGIAASADDAISISDVRTGRVAYVTLPLVDPSQVECVSGRAVVLHAVTQKPGFVTSAVDLATHRVTGGGHVPEGSGLWAAAAGSVWTTVATSGPDAFALVRVDPTTLATSPGPALGFTPCGVAESAGRVLVLGSSGADGRGMGRLAVLDADADSVTASATVPGLPHGAQSAVEVAGVLVLGDWNGGMPETSSLVVLERTTLRPLRTIEVGGAPCAVAAYGGRLLVVERVSGILLSIDPLTGKVDWRADLGARDLVCSKVVVVPARID